MTDKDKKIIADAKKNGTPIFVLTAKDSMSIRTMYNYMFHCEDNGCDAEHINGVNKRIKEFAAWKGQNPDKVHTPD